MISNAHVQIIMDGTVCKWSMQDSIECFLTPSPLFLSVLSVCVSLSLSLSLVHTQTQSVRTCLHGDGTFAWLHVSSCNHVKYLLV